MTLEEAGEVILLNEPFTPCESCVGIGYRWSTNEQDEKNVRLCTDCKAQGWVVVPEHAAACEALGLPLPIWDRSKKGIAGIVVQNVFRHTENRWAKSETMRKLIEIVHHEEDELGRSG